MRYLACFVLFFLGACEENPETQKPFQAMIIADTHLKEAAGENADRLRELVTQLNRGDFPRVEFLVVTGDVVDYVYETYDEMNPLRDDNRLDMAVQILDMLDIPYYLGMGNHDYAISKDTKSTGYFSPEEIQRMNGIWEEHTGFAPYFALEHRGWRLLFLNSTMGRPWEVYFDDDQLSWLEGELQGQMPTILLFHHPVPSDHELYWADSNFTTREKEARFYALLEAHLSKIKAIFVGHGHLWVRDTIQDTIWEYETAGFGKLFPDVRNYHLITCDAELQSLEVKKGGPLGYIEDTQP